MSARRRRVVSMLPPLAGAAVAVPLALSLLRHVRIDACLDAGARWSYELNACVGASATFDLLRVGLVVAAIALLAGLLVRAATRLLLDRAGSRWSV